MLIFFLIFKIFVSFLLRYDFLNILIYVFVLLGLSHGMGTLSHGMWDLVPWPGMEPASPALGAQS